MTAAHVEHGEVPEALTVLPGSVHGDDVTRTGRQRHVTVADPVIGPVSVRWFMDRELRWRCREHGDQTEPDCVHTFSAGLLLAEHLLGLTRIPELDAPNPKGTPDD